MSLTKTLTAAAAILTALTGCATTHHCPSLNDPGQPSITFQYAGPGATATNSANAPWNTPTTALQGSIHVTAAGHIVMCRILVNGLVVAESHGAVADCAWRLDV